MTSSNTFVAFDFETTGLMTQTDRVIEIGCVKFDNQFLVVDEFETLINPRRDVGRSDIHGITPQMLRDAPEFSEIAGEFLSFLDGSVLIAHNKSFDLRFLDAEIRRMGITQERPDALCTMELVRSVFPQSPRQLSRCCEYLGIETFSAHEAIADASMAAKIAMRILHEFGYPAIPKPAIFSRIGWREMNRPPVSRGDIRMRDDLKSGYLQKLVSELPDDVELKGRNAVASAEYLNLLDQVLLDREIVVAEAESLIELARNLKLSRAEIETLHNSYLYNLCSVALSDGRLEPSEIVDIQEVAELLEIREWQQVIDLLSHNLRDSESYSNFDLTGLSVCFTGTMSVTRDEIEDLARSCGMTVLAGVTKRLDLLVVADPFSESSKARKARDYGTQIVAESAFREMVLLHSKSA